MTFSFTTGKIGGGWVDWHMKSGYAILALLLFRLAWGLIGSDTARFSHFVRGPRAALAHGRHALAGRHGASLGHNPLGGWMVLAMLAILLAQAASGLFVDDEIANQGPLAAKVSNALVARMSALHSWNQWAIAAAVALHVLAIAVYGFALRVNLVGPMVHGWTAVPEGLRPPDPRHSHPGLALGLLAACAAFVYWLVVVYPKG